MLICKMTETMAYFNSLELLIILFPVLKSDWPSGILRMLMHSVMAMRL